MRFAQCLSSAFLEAAGGIVGRLLGGIALRSAATARVNLRDQHFVAAVGLGLTEAASVAAPSRAVLKAATHAEGSKTVRSSASSRAEGSRTPES
jgi:hypothetical protein